MRHDCTVKSTPPFSLRLTSATALLPLTNIISCVIMCVHCHPSRSHRPPPQFETSQSPSRLRRRSGLSRRVKRRCQRGSVCCSKEKNRLSVDFICLFDSPLDCWSVHGARGGAAPALLVRANGDKPNPPSGSAQTNVHPHLWVFHEANTHCDSRVTNTIFASWLFGVLELK